MSTSLRKKPAPRRKPSETYHHGNLREALIAEGLAALAARDQAEVSLRELARRVGVSPNAAYRHFSDKEGLLAALAAEGFRRLASAGASAAAQCSDPSAALNLYGRAYVDFALDNPGLFRLMFGGSISRNASDELARESAKALEQLRLGIALEEGLPPDDPRVGIATVYAWSVVHGLAHLILDGQIDGFATDTGRLIEAILAISSSAG